MGLLALGQSGIPGTAQWRQGVADFLFPEAPAPLAGAVLYAIWWARGVSVNPYLRRRGFGVFVVNTAAYIAAWIALAWLSFDPKALRGLV